jgi:hypothetical protein
MFSILLTWDFEPRRFLIPLCSFDLLIFLRVIFNISKFIYIPANERRVAYKEYDPKKHTPHIITLSAYSPF